MTRVLVTGANGFIGRALCRRLLASGFVVRAAVRRTCPDLGAEQVVVHDPNSTDAWAEALQGVDVIIHLAARVHVMQDSAADALEASRQMNVAVTETLALAAAAQGVNRFVFLSTIKVNGEKTVESPFRDEDVPSPQDPYAISKWEAEQVLRNIAQGTRMQVVVIRPPLVYGPGVKANFLRLLKWVDHGVPLPFLAVRNRRSMIYLENLVDVLMLAINHSRAVGHVWLVSDGEDVSTPELIRKLAIAMGKHERLWFLPMSVLRLLGRISGKSAEAERLLGSLQVDSSSIRRELDWVPPYTMSQGLTETISWYREFSGHTDA